MAETAGVGTGTDSSFARDVATRPTAFPCWNPRCDGEIHTRLSDECLRGHHRLKVRRWHEGGQMFTLTGVFFCSHGCKQRFLVSNPGGRGVEVAFRACERDETVTLDGFQTDHLSRPDPVGEYTDASEQAIDGRLR